MDMDMGSSSNSTELMMTMTPYLHFTGGDFLFFKSITPSSNGAIAGAAIFLFFLAIFERVVVAMRAVMENRWKQRAKALVEHHVLLTEKCHDAGLSQPSLPSVTKKRVIPPFVLSQDVSRGAMHALQSFIHFAIMLAVMTFQAAYIIAIIIGLGVGEVLFGRLSAQLSLHSH
ncbi:uncharacterized protein FOMMEDRAFT_167322 [Fomitiporia mediterranea MF3/22]|uniref:uncharacterized protein n=1 Tax=Fomitiporia mediterranea (strain MF3/22) TaxID=694068 RepID=UPI0004407945|nr:uncharacterized protein FOMMEDRAFT_167322 [Fomitiporia mediterranea MF3/22]EJD04040.1 hypothetical protein FOMMEDRAFT_167322 [Fomitiporia mediterranea MF3/22]